MITRRRFMQSAVALGSATFAGTGFSQAPSLQTLAIERRTIDVNGKAASVFGLENADGGQGLWLNQEDGFAVRLSNGLNQPSLIHWHGLLPPTELDGVPDVSQPALLAGEQFDYVFDLPLSGTNWMHSHVGFQEQQMMAAPLIVRSKAERDQDVQDVSIILHDFSFRSPEELFAELKSGEAHGSAMKSSGSNNDELSADVMDHSEMDMSNTNPEMDHGSMDMSGSKSGMDHSSMDMSEVGMSQDSMGMEMDLNDIEFDAMLANDRTANDPEIIAVDAGTPVRLRIINAGASTNFWIDLGALNGEVVAVDGMPVHPVRGSRFPISMAQRLDIMVTLDERASSAVVRVVQEGGRMQAGVILAAKGAQIRKFSDMADIKSPEIDLSLERQLMATNALPNRPVDRTINVDLTGAMSPYAWSLEGDALQVKEGERVALTMRNKTMMSHPMHLHGHHFQVTQLSGKTLQGAQRDTVLVPIGESVTVEFEARNAGNWAFHCHNLYHMQAGMMGVVKYI